MEETKRTLKPLKDLNLMDRFYCIGNAVPYTIKPSGGMRTTRNWNVSANADALRRENVQSTFFLIRGGYRRPGHHAQHPGNHSWERDCFKASAPAREGAANYTAKPFH